MPAAPDKRALLIFCAVPSRTLEIVPVPSQSAVHQRESQGNRPKQVRLKKDGNR